MIYKKSNQTSITEGIIISTKKSRKITADNINYIDREFSKFLKNLNTILDELEKVLEYIKNGTISENAEKCKDMLITASRNYNNSMKDYEYPEFLAVADSKADFDFFHQADYRNKNFRKDYIKFLKRFEDSGKYSTDIARISKRIDDIDRILEKSVKELDSLNDSKSNETINLFISILYTTRKISEDLSNRISMMKRSKFLNKYDKGIIESVEII